MEFKKCGKCRRDVVRVCADGRCSECQARKTRTWEVYPGTPRAPSAKTLATLAIMGVFAKSLGGTTRGPRP